VLVTRADAAAAAFQINGDTMQFVDQSNNIGVFGTDEAETLVGKPRKRPHISAVIGMTGGQRRLRAGGFPISTLEPHNKIPLGFQFGKFLCRFGA
jgi:hypothetical protein